MRYFICRSELCVATRVHSTLSKNQRHHSISSTDLVCYYETARKRDVTIVIASVCRNTKQLVVWCTHNKSFLALVRFQRPKLFRAFCCWNNNFECQILSAGSHAQLKSVTCFPGHRSYPVRIYTTEIRPRLYQYNTRIQSIQERKNNAIAGLGAIGVGAGGTGG